MRQQRCIALACCSGILLTSSYWPILYREITGREELLEMAMLRNVEHFVDVAVIGSIANF